MEGSNNITGGGGTIRLPSTNKDGTITMQKELNIASVGAIVPGSYSLSQEQNNDQLISETKSFSPQQSGTTNAHQNGMIVSPSEDMYMKSKQLSRSLSSHLFEKD